MNYIEIDFNVSPTQPWTDILVSELAEIGFDSFVEHDNGTKAYIPKKEWNEESLKAVETLNTSDVTISYTTAEIEGQNWNENWESQFEPIEINDQCRIKAPFHNIGNEPYDIVISPEMAFGTGHHETTFLMSQVLFKLDLKNKSILDMGCGTGVLAILTEKLGALNVMAIDIDEYAYNNTVLNLSLNQTERIQVKQGGAEKIDTMFDVILANINKNILLQDIATYAKALKQKGLLLLSGFFKTDEQDLISAGEKVGLQFVISEHKNNWAMVQLKKQ